jgi:uncharacterized protein with NRDE domain
MCLILFSWKAHPDYELIVAANRDEWRDRPTAPAQWWDDAPDLLAGRDLKAGGTWMGITRNGRFAAITNFRDPSDKRSTAPSRGTLVMDFLLEDRTPREFLEAVSHRDEPFNGFNLIAGDGKKLMYLASRDGVVREVESGIHGLSNHVLDEPWPKVTQGRIELQKAMREPLDAEALFTVLSDRTMAPDSALPETGVGLEWERVLSPALIVAPDYGTRSSTVLTIGKNGDVEFEERSRGPDGAIASKAGYLFTIEH